MSSYIDIHVCLYSNCLTNLQTMCVITEHDMNCRLFTDKKYNVDIKKIFIQELTFKRNNY